MEKNQETDAPRPDHNSVKWKRGVGAYIRIAHVIKKGLDTGERLIEFQGKRRLKLTEKELHDLFDLLKFHYDEGNP